MYTYIRKQQKFWVSKQNVLVWTQRMIQEKKKVRIFVQVELKINHISEEHCDNYITAVKWGLSKYFNTEHNDSNVDFNHQ